MKSASLASWCEQRNPWTEFKRLYLFKEIDITDPQTPNIARCFAAPMYSKEQYLV